MRILINVQSFIDDADSLRRKRQKHNNSSSTILFKHVAETEKREYICRIFHNSTAYGIMVGNIVDYHPNMAKSHLRCKKIMLFILTSRFSLKESS